MGGRMNILQLILYLIMFTRVFAGGMQRAASSLLRPSFNPSFSIASPKFLHLETTSLLSRISPLSSNLHVQNLLSFLEKCEQQLQTKSEVNSLNQLSLLAQDDRLVFTNTTISRHTGRSNEIASTATQQKHTTMNDEHLIYLYTTITHQKHTTKGGFRVERIKASFRLGWVRYLTYYFFTIYTDKHHKLKTHQIYRQLFVMQFDILNELVTSTVSDLFSNNESLTIECKPKVRQLEGLIRQENNSRRGSITSQNDSFSVLSDASRQSSSSRPQPIRYKTVAEWVQKQAPKRLKQAFKKLGLEQNLMKSNRKADLQQHIDAMTVDGLANEKKKVKNELKNYDNDFNGNFKKQPNHEEKEPLRPLYVYYKKLKEALTRRGGEELSQEKIEAMIAKIKTERRELREKIESYQQEFERNNHRKIRYVRDIAPIDGEYRKYKELKVDLQKYEQMLNK